MKALMSTVNKPWYQDTLLLGVMSIGAGCGMIYEYLVAHYAGRILGSVDTAVYSMIGLMVVAMGVGAFYARTIKCAYSGFAWLEAWIALIGGGAVLVMAGIFSFAYVLPLQLQHAYGLHETIEIHGGLVFFFEQLAESFPYIIGLLLGFLIGMEIPFIARIRQNVHKNTLKHNAGTVYGADYIGGGIGAAIWVFVCLHQPIIISAAMTALLNLILGAIFLIHFYPKIKQAKYLVLVKVITGGILIAILFNGSNWMNAMSNMLYTDNVAYSNNTRYQNLVITERAAGGNRPSIISLYINSHLQFSNSDEVIYHSMLVTPAMLAAAKHKNILIIGGGDGLAARDILKWSPDSITLIDLDPVMIKIFQGQQPGVPDWLNQRLLKINQGALNDPRLHYLFGDAFKVVEKMANTGKYFDVIVVVLPDPNHPDLNKLYSSYFYSKLASLMNADGAIVVQSTSPYHSKKAFLSIGKTMAAVGLKVDQYHANVPSFGEWGWSLATKTGLSPRERIKHIEPSEFKHSYLTYEQLIGSFAFSKTFYRSINEIKVNHLNTPTLYTYHSEGWRREKGVFQTF